MRTIHEDTANRRAAWLVPLRIAVLILALVLLPFSHTSEAAVVLETEDVPSDAEHVHPDRGHPRRRKDRRRSARLHPDALAAGCG